MLDVTKGPVVFQKVVLRTNIQILVGQVDYFDFERKVVAPLIEGSIVN